MLRIRVPAAIVDVTLLVYRFTMVTAEVAERARISQASRMGYAGFRRSMRSAGLLAASLLPRVLDKATRMETRACGPGLRRRSPGAFVAGGAVAAFRPGSVARRRLSLPLPLTWLAAGIGGVSS